MTTINIVIPDNVALKARLLSVREGRSENQQMLVLLKQGLALEEEKASKEPIPVETQVKLWRMLAWRWKDDRKTNRAER